MVKTLKGLFMAGVPLFAVVFLCGAFYYAGAHFSGKKPNGKYVVAERSAAILEAMMSAGGSAPELEKQISIPVLGVVKKYSDAGYVVIDADRDENGFMVIAGVPPGTRDVTNEMRAAIALARKGVEKGASHAVRP